MNSKGRPKVSPVQLKNGFYIEIYDKGSKSGMKIRSESKQSMEDAANHYSKFKEVVVLGEYKDGAPVKRAATA